MDEQTFEIKIAEFEGPFDLLLFFIERDEIDIHDISISKITSDFLLFIRHLQSLNIEIASEFILVAATLMRIKAKTLLPKHVVDEEGNEVDLRQNLIERLIIYKQFKEIAVSLRQLEDDRYLIKKRGNIGHDLQLAAQKNGHSEELSSFDLYKIMQAYEKLMKNFLRQEHVEKHTIIQYPYTITGQKKAIATLLEINGTLDFQLIAQQSENRVHFVYNFLAILEMLQQEFLDLRMGIGYNNFWIRKAN